jgi:hypothetical protein
MDRHAALAMTAPGAWIATACGLAMTGQGIVVASEARQSTCRVQNMAACLRHPTTCCPTRPKANHRLGDHKADFYEFLGSRGD